jgi:multimeric flavodoxin WrbA
MNAVILDGSARGDPLAAAVRDAAEARLRQDGIAVTRHFLPDVRIAPCNGDFQCWTRTPGVCAQAGRHRDIAREIAFCDLEVLLTPVTFGGYSSELKKLLDHLIPIIVPTLVRFHGETHHPMRYGRFPRLAVFGTRASADEESERIFEGLVRRNVLNMRPPSWACGVFHAGDGPGAVAERVGALIDRAWGRS